MGCCYCRQGDDVFNYPADDPGQCLRGVAACGYTQEPCKGDCLLTGELANYFARQYGSDDIAIFAVRPMFDALYDVRDLVLKNSSLGVEILHYYRDHIPRALELLQSDPDLMKRTLRLVAFFAAFSVYLKGVHEGRDEPRITGMLFESRFAEEGVAVLGRLSERDASGELSDALALAGNLLSQFADRTSSQIYELLRVQL